MSFGRAFVALVRDLVRQAWATGLVAGLAVAVVTAVAFVAMSRVEPAGVNTPLGVFGIPVEWDRVTAGRYLAFLVVDVLADRVGVIATLLWTAGFLPAFLHPGQAAVLMAKPLRRWPLLAAKLLAVVAFVAAVAVIAIAGPVLAAGVVHGAWYGTAFVAMPWFLVHFLSCFGFSAMLAVATRNAAACMIGTLLFWATCFGVDYGHHAFRGFEVAEATAGMFRLLDLAAAVFPKPVDLSMLMHDAMQDGSFIERPVELAKSVAKVPPSAAWSAGTSLLAGAVFAGLALYEFEATEL